MTNFLTYLLTNVGLLYGLVMFVRALNQSLRADTRLYEPAAYQAEKLKAHPTRPGEFGPDLAWPVYPLRQAGVDKKHVRQNLFVAQRRLWRGPSNTFFKGRNGPLWLWWIFLIPITAIVLFFLVETLAASWFSYWVYWAVLTAGQFVDRTMVAALRGQMRVREDRRRVTQHTDAACMNCLHVTPWPAYACPGCGLSHHDVMPGDLGTLFRTCGKCGTRFPTLPSRAAWHATAICKRTECQQPLPQGAGAVTDIRVPVFGDTAAGKTRFLYASLNSLLADLDRAHVKYEYLDQDSRLRAERWLKSVRANEPMAKTPEEPATAINLRLHEGKRSSFIHLFDAAGEQFSKPGNWDFEVPSKGTNYGSLRFIEDGQALAYILDPFSVGLIRDRAAAADQAVLAEANPARKDPEIAYSEVVNRLRGNGVPIGAQRLAVIVSKADLLRKVGLAVPTDSADIAAWLTENGVHNLVLASAREFREVRFFTVASTDASAGRGDDPGIPLRWLLASHGVKVPGGNALIAKPARRPVGASS